LFLKVSYSGTARLLNELGWSWRVPTRYQLAKYTQDNLDRYYIYLHWIQDLDWKRLKFLDESHIVPKSLYKQKVLGIKGTRTFIPNDSLNEPHASITILTQLEKDEPVVVTYRELTNNQWDFTDFIVYACGIGALKQGDILIMDNSTVHGVLASWFALSAILNAYDIKLVYLPAYSPELNPAENVFHGVKKYIKQNRRIGKKVLTLVIESIASISYNQMVEWYANCIYPCFILPDLC